MSSSYPPQLQLSIQPNTTSFKRSFEQFGFDLGSPVEGGAGNSNNGNDRNKRARSASHSFSDSNDSMESSSSSSSSSLTTTTTNSFTSSQSSSSSSGLNSSSTFAAGSVPVTGASLTMSPPPRLPTPDIEMSDHSLERSLSQRESEEQFRLSLERFHTFESHITILRQSRPTSPTLNGAPTRAQTPPPILPPLDIPGQQARLSLISTATVPPTNMFPPLAEVLFGEHGPRDEDEDEDEEEEVEEAVSRPLHSTVSGVPEVVHFQARLHGALEGIRAQSPLVPGLTLEDEQEQIDSFVDVDVDDDSDEQLDETSLLTPDPPTLPPISSNADIVHFSLEELLSNNQYHPSSTVAEALALSSNSAISPSLPNHPLPSPMLRDLRSFIDGRQSNAQDHDAERLASGLTNPSLAGQRRMPAIVSNPEGRLDHSLSLDQMRRSSQLLDNLWERRSLELWSHSDETRQTDTHGTGELGSRPLSSRNSHSSILPLSFDYSADRPNLNRMEPSVPPPRPRVRISSSSSLVTENALEARRRVDRDDLIGTSYARPTWMRRESEMDSTGDHHTPVDYDRNFGVVHHSSLPVPPPMRRSVGREGMRVNPPPYLQLPPLPNPSLDVHSDNGNRDPDHDRDEEERVHELVTRSAGQIPRPRWYAQNGATSASSTHTSDSGSDWLQRQQEGETLGQQRTRHPIRSTSLARERMASSSSNPSTFTLPQPLSPASPLLSPLGSFDLDFFPNSNSARGTSRVDMDEDTEPERQTERPPFLPPPDLGHTFDSDEDTYVGVEERGEASILMHLRGQYQQRPGPRILRSDDGSSQPGRLPVFRPPIQPRVGGHSTSARYGSHSENSSTNRTIPSSSVTSASSTSYRPMIPSPSDEQGPSDWRHQTMLRLEENRHQLQILNQRQRSLEALFQETRNRSGATQMEAHTQPPAITPTQPVSAVPGSSRERTDYLPIELSRYDRHSRHEGSMNTNVDTVLPTTTTSQPTPPTSYLRPLYLEERARYRNPATSSSSNLPYPSLGAGNTLDPESFAPSPFRNNMAMQQQQQHPQQFHQQRPNRVHPRPPPFPSTAVFDAQPPSVPPLIPPLPFQATNPAYPPYPSTQSRRVSIEMDEDFEEDEEEVLRRYRVHITPDSSGNGTSRQDPFNFGLSRRVSHPHGHEDQNSTARRAPVFPSHIQTHQHTVISPASSTSSSNGGSSTSSPSEYRPPSDLHRYLTQHVRMEPARLESSSPASPVNRSFPSSSSSVSVSGSGSGPPSYIEPMRPNGQNSMRQLQLMQLRQHEMNRRLIGLGTRNEGESSRSGISANGNGNGNGNGNTGTNSGFGTLGGPFLRRFENDGFASWRNRRRARHAAARLGTGGDFMHDDDFDDSYEGLLNLAATLGDVKPKSTPAEVLAKLEKGTYREWKASGGDQRCPICLDDYSDDDRLLKLNNCTHWLHDGCLQQWLNSANTCPVCRECVQTSGSSVSPSTSTSPSSRRIHHYRLPLFRRTPQPVPNNETNGPSEGSRSGSGAWASAFREFD